METLPLTGPLLPGDPAVVSHEGTLIVLGATMAALRQEARATSWASHSRAVSANEQLCSVQLQYDKLLLRMFDTAVRSDRLDRAFQLATRYAALTLSFDSDSDLQRLLVSSVRM
jgi:hypothetical protein